MYFLISDPPHSDNLDLAKAAPLFGLSLGEVKIKGAFPAPELWFSEKEKHLAITKARELKQAGIKLLVAHESEVADVPLGRSFTSFEFAENGLEIWSESFQTSLNYSSRLVAVLCKPIILGAEYQRFRDREESKKAQTKREKEVQTFFDGDSSDLIASVIEEQYRNAFIDLYIVEDGKIERLTGRINELDFAGLGSRIGTNKKESIENLATLLSEKFTKLILDKRLMDVPYREPVVNGRRLAKIGSAFSPGIAGATRMGIHDFASRVCFLINDIRPKPEDLTTIMKIDRSS